MTTASTHGLKPRLPTCGAAGWFSSSTTRTARTRATSCSRPSTPPAGFTADERGLPVLDRASVTLDCTAHARHEGGDHTILLGHVERTRIGDEEPAVYFRRGFRGLTEAE